MRKFFVLLTILSNTYIFSFCQYPEINFKQIYINQGLPEPFLMSIIQDKEGFIWTAQSKLYKYDGYTFTAIEDLPKCKECPIMTSMGIYAMTTDNLGIIWILMDAGIVLFDPETEKSVVLRSFAWNDTLNPYLFQKLDLLRDSKGNIWISGMPGLLKISYKKENLNQVTKENIFTYKLHTIYNIDTLYITPDKYSAANAIISVYEDSGGNIWAGSAEGVYLLKEGEKSFLRIDDGRDGKTRLSQGSAFQILEENKDTFWIATLTALNRITNVRNALFNGNSDKSLLRFSKTKHLDQSSLALLKDRKNRIISGLFILNKNDLKEGDPFVSLYQGMQDPEAKGFNFSANKIMQDRTGVIWILQALNGILKFNLDQSAFISYEKTVKDYLKQVNTIFEDEKGNIWIGSFGKGVIKIQHHSYKVSHFSDGFNLNIICMTEIEPGIFWAGLYGGVIEFNSHTGTFRKLFTESRESRNLMSSTVWDILRDKNQVYIAAEAGIFVYDLQHKFLSQFSVTNNDSLCSTRNERFYALLKAKDGTIWTSSVGVMGLSKLSYNSNTRSLTFLPFVSKDLTTLNLINNFNSVLFQDSHGIFWIGNSDLHRIDIKTGTINSFKLNTTLQNWIIRSIQEDDHDNLWMGTITGLIRFNTITGKSKNFSSLDGLPISQHDHHTSFKNREGRMYFGGVKGFYSFDPDSLKINESLPPVVITNLKLFNKSIKIDTSEQAILRKNIAYTSLIKLRHNQNDLAFEFAALDYNHPMSNKYAYRLEPYQDNWVETDASNRIASYTNLDPGKYIFRVKAANNDGVWNEQGTSLSVIIKKPWWATLFAWILYGLIIMAAIRGFILWRSLSIMKDKDELEKLVKIRTLQLEEQNEEIASKREEILFQRDKLVQQNLKIIENEELKNRFFTNVSHEFRTPLSLIQGPVEELLEDTRLIQKQKQKLNMILKNSHKLLSFVNQLLDISKIDGNSMKLELVEFDVMKYLRAIAGSFNSLAEARSIRYDTRFDEKSFKSWSDPDKLEKIAVNMLSNAFKFTPEGGEIIFSAGYTESDNPMFEKILEFSVKDTGTGIPEASLGKIFDRFYQVESSMKNNTVGTGIGLSLAMEVAKLMHGDIRAESELCKGSTFRVNIPLGKDHLKESEFIILTSLPELETLKHISGETYTETFESNTLNGGKPDKPIVLIVEDNKDIREHLIANLSSKYHIVEAIDGVAGMKKAAEIIPDLIITDLMMPRLDGFEMCSWLKNDERTSHIPIIMLTAKSTLQDKIDGYHAGADEYMPKPFHIAELKARLVNILEQRRKLRERFSREITLEPHEISITSLDEKFLNRAIEIVERHIGNENFDLTVFRKEMNMSRSTLFRKLQALTGQSPTEFIRTFRLKRAANLLKQNFGNVTQISYEVGFNNLSYFNRSFKKLYGVSATEYAMDK